VRVTVLGDASLFSSAQTVRAAGALHRVEPGTPTTLTVPLARCRARFAISPTRAPASDPRPLGLHFLSFEYVPPR
jgi:hypothetical protein